MMDLVVIVGFITAISVLSLVSVFVNFYVNEKAFEKAVEEGNSPRKKTICSGCAESILRRKTDVK